MTKKLIFGSMNELELGASVRNVISGALTSTITAPFDEETFFSFGNGYMERNFWISI